MGMKIRVAFDKNRTILQDSDISGDEGQRRERLVSSASEVNRLGPPWNAKADEHLTAIRMLFSRYLAKVVVHLDGRPADRTGRKVNRGRKPVLRKIVNDRASSGHAYDGRHQVN